MNNNSCAMPYEPTRQVEPGTFVDDDKNNVL